jgi:hypothetical protein
MKKINKEAAKSLIDWCETNNLMIYPNSEVFFISENVLMRPEYIINNRTYVDVVEKREITDKYIEYCKLFAKSFGTIVLIPLEEINDIITVNKKDIETYFKVKI